MSEWKRRSDHTLIQTLKNFQNIYEVIMLRKCIAEYVGTMILVFCGTSAIVVNDISGGVITHVGIAMVFGMVVASIIYS